MEAGIVGLPFAGKTALFNALAAGHVAGGAVPTSGGGGIKPNIAVAPVPDPRLQIINQFIATDRIVPASLKITDVPGLVRGSSTGSGLGNKFLTHIRNVEALVHVVRCFQSADVAHVEGSIDPVRDVDTIDTELMLADLEQIETSLDKARRLAKGADREAKVRLEVLEACHAALGEGQPVRNLSFDNPEAVRTLRNMAVLSAKPVLYVANVDESDPTGASPLATRLRDRLEKQGAAVIPVCAKLEAELAQLDEADRTEMLKGLGLAEPALAVLARAVLRLLGQQYFFTAGKIEIKAWSIPIGATAPQAAGAIHSDFERGFIRVEVYSVADLQQYKTEAAIKHAGKLRVEGKEYVMHDGDVCHFLFNV